MASSVSARWEIQGCISTFIWVIIRHRKTLREDYASACPAALLLCGGDEPFWIERGILAVPWYRVI